MKYDVLRDQIRSGDLLAWSQKGIHSLGDIVSHAIRFATESEYQHVGMAWVSGGRIFVIEAYPPEIRVRPLSDLTPFYHVNMNVQWNHEVERFLLDRVGQKYSYLEALRAYFGRPIKNNQLWECGEFAHDFYATAGIDLGDAYTPAEVVEAALKQDVYPNPVLNYITA